jgi:hypothetical protein
MEVAGEGKGAKRCKNLQKVLNEPEKALQGAVQRLQI